jgi:large subunit ribosomal protein L23
MATKDLYKDEKTKGESKKTADNKISMAYKVLVKPLVTEKGANFATSGKYLFEVAGSTNKVEVKKAIEDVYGIKPLDVNIMNVLGKAKRVGRIKGKRKDWKKAIITLPKGKTINVYEGV